MTPCFFLALPPPPNREIGGISLSISVPAVFISPSRNAFSINFRVSSGFSFSSVIIALRSWSRCSTTNSCHSFMTSSTSLIPAIKVSISCFLLRSSGLASIALLMVIRTSLSSQWVSWYFFTSMRI